jgi:hypothetical protein
MIDLTSEYRVLPEHIRFSKGIKSICVSTCLNFFGITPNTYNYTSSSKNRTAYINVLRSRSYSVRSRVSEFKVKKFKTTLTELRTNMKRSGYQPNDYFIVQVANKGAAHLIVLNGDGQTVIDTAPRCRWKVIQVHKVF